MCQSQQTELGLRLVALQRLGHHLGIDERVVLEEDGVLEPVLEVQGDLLAHGSDHIRARRARIRRPHEVHDVQDLARLMRIRRLEWQTDRDRRRKGRNGHHAIHGHVEWSPIKYTSCCHILLSFSSHGEKYSIFRRYLHALPGSQFRDYVFPIAQGRSPQKRTIPVTRPLMPLGNPNPLQIMLIATAEIHTHECQTRIPVSIPIAF